MLQLRRRETRQSGYTPLASSVLVRCLWITHTDPVTRGTAAELRLPAPKPRQLFTLERFIQCGVEPAPEPTTMSRPTVFFLTGPVAPAAAPTITSGTRFELVPPTTPASS